MSFPLQTAIPVYNWFLLSLRISFITAKRGFKNILKDNIYHRLGRETTFGCWVSVGHWEAARFGIHILNQNTKDYILGSAIYWKIPGTVLQCSEHVTSVKEMLKSTWKHSTTSRKALLNRHRLFKAQLIFVCLSNKSKLSVYFTIEFPHMTMPGSHPTVLEDSFTISVLSFLAHIPLFLLLFLFLLSLVSFACDNQF